MVSAEREDQQFGPSKNIMSKSAIKDSLTPATEPATGAGPNCAESPGSVTYALFKHMADEHGLMLLESEMAEIVRIVNDNLEARLRWWITNAEGIAKERVELFRVGERMHKMLVLAPDAPVEQWPSAPEIMEVCAAWDAAAQPIREMASSPNNPVRHGGAQPRSCL